MFRLLNFYYRTKYILKEIFRLLKQATSQSLDELGIFWFSFYILRGILFICFCVFLSLFIGYIIIKREIVSVGDQFEQWVVDFFDSSISNFVNYLNEAESKKELERLQQLQKEEEEKKIANTLLLEQELAKVKREASKLSSNKTLFVIGFVAGCAVAAVIYVLSNS